MSDHITYPRGHRQRGDETTGKEFTEKLPTRDSLPQLSLQCRLVTKAVTREADVSTTICRLLDDWEEYIIRSEKYVELTMAREFDGQWKQSKDSRRKDGVGLRDSGQSRRVLAKATC